MADLRRAMTLAIQRFNRSVPLLDRTVPMPNIMAIFVPPGGPGVLGVLQGLFDAGEIPMARLAFVRDRGESVVAVPVFPDRIFVHQYVYTRTNTGINSPAEGAFAMRAPRHCYPARSFDSPSAIHIRSRVW